ncbi:hypothetical protein THIAE_06615 [Thiomicrospira aerophila AL3]|uniref:DUF2066 domain-containing protein n=1 Tax=Thiomicrospira aerophila AL3 TaxID=717772 RepID=W0DS57_9GAMM|nr:DUF2066 domain-containing protein [Thiomicrospira aerophila]AHF01470.1 hypothetical protein THIAE_06615 [Thiomicrospira aerophila AL3]
MRSFRNYALLVSLLPALLLMMLTPVKAEDSFFSVDIEIASFDQSQLDRYFAEAMAALLVRVSGNPDITALPATQSFSSQARKWVQNYQLVNRQIDGVVVGQNVRVEFNTSKLVPALQQANVAIWPESQRPRLLIVGDWLQRGLSAQISNEGFIFRPDLDFRHYLDLIGLPQVYLAHNEQYHSHGISPLPQIFSEQNLVSLQQASDEGVTHVVVVSAQVVGDVVQVRSQYYDLAGNKLRWEQVLLGENFNQLVLETFDRILLEESTQYFAKSNISATLWLEIDHLPDAAAINHIERRLSANSLVFDQIRLVQIEGRAAHFNIHYRGDLKTVLANVEAVLPVRMVFDDRAVGHVRYHYQYSN